MSFELVLAILAVGFSVGMYAAFREVCRMFTRIMMTLTTDSRRGGIADQGNDDPPLLEEDLFDFWDDG